MATRQVKKATRSAASTNDAGPPPASIAVGGPGEGETTGRFVIIFKHEALDDKTVVKSTLSKVGGIKELASSADYADGAVSASDLAGHDAIHFPKLGIVVVGPDD